MGLNELLITKDKIAFSETDKDFIKMSPASLIKRMQEKTDKEGFLLVPAEPYDTRIGREGKEFYRYEMSWTKEDADNIAKEFGRIYKAIEKMASLGPELSGDREENGKYLNEEELEIWEKYIKDLSDGLFEKDIERSLGRLILEDRLGKMARPKKSRHGVDRYPVPSDEEIFRFWEHNDEIKRRIKGRFDDGHRSFDVFIRAQRLYGLMVMEASEKLIKREAKRLAKVIAINRFCVRICGSTTLYSGLAIPIYHAKNIDEFRDFLLDGAFYEICIDDPIQDNEYLRWISVYNAEVKYGEELMDEYDAYDPLDYADYLMDRYVKTNKEINPLGIDLGCYSSFNGLNFIRYEADDEETKKVQKFTEEEIVNALKNFAKKYGISEKLVGHYEILAY